MSKDNKQFLILGDVHVRSRTWTNNTLLSGDAYAALDTIADKTKDITDTVLIAGDWFDTNRPTSTDLERTFQFLSNYRRVLFIRGNHDSVEPSFLLSGKDVMNTDISIEHLSDTTVDGVAVHGVDWMPSRKAMSDRIDEISNLIGQSEKTDHIILMHIGLKELIGIDGAYDFEASEIASRLKQEGKNITVIVGHIHIKDDFVTDGVRFISPGSVYANNVQEMNNTFSVKLLGVTKTVDVPCCVRHYYMFDAADGLEDAMLSALKDCEDDKLSPFARISVPDGYDKALPDVPAFIVQVEHAGDNTQVAAGEQLAEETIADAVSAECGDDEDLRELCSALLTADDPVGLMSGWLDTWGAERIN